MKGQSDGRRNPKGGAMWLLRICMLLILLVSAGVFITKLITFAELSRERDQLQEQKEQYEHQIAELTYRLNSPIDYDDIVRIAREKLGLAFPDDTVYYSETDDKAN